MDQRQSEDAIAALNKKQTVFFSVLGGFVLVTLVALGLLWTPVMKPWVQERAGLAKLRQAEYDNKIQAEQSAAERDAAELRAQAIAIVGDVAKKYPEYRSQEFIGGFADAMRAGTIDQTFYIPTAASVPVLPAMANPVANLLTDPESMPGTTPDAE